VGKRARLHPSLLGSVGVLLVWGAARAVWSDLEKANFRRARTLVGQRQYVEAETLARESVGIAESYHGADSLEVADGLDVLVEALRGMGSARNAEASKLAERAIPVDQAPGLSLIAKGP